jgi:hypothetical protein
MTHMGNLSTAMAPRRRVNTSKAMIQIAVPLPTHLRHTSSKVTTIRTSSTDRTNSTAIRTHSTAMVRSPTVNPVRLVVLVVLSKATVALVQA